MAGGGGICRDTSSVGGADKGTRIVGKGDIFGECGLFTKELGLLRRESAKTQSWVSVYVLTAAALREVSLEYPEVSSWLLPNPRNVPCVQSTNPFTQTHTRQ